MSPPSSSPSTRLVAPALPVAPTRPSFPLVATLAPVLMSVVLWLVTHSPFALMFAALGPGIAVASLLDARIGGRRRARAEEVRFQRELQETRVEIAAEHDREREAIAQTAPGAHGLLHGREHVRWGGSMPTEVRLGLSTRRSGLAMDGVGTIRGNDTASQQLRSIREEAGLLLDAPLVVAIGSGIGVTGPPVESAALARAILVQLLAACSPAQFRVEGEAAWLDALPHLREPGTSGSVAVLGEGTRIVVATARDPAALPATVQTVVRVNATMATLDAQPFAPEFLSAEEAIEWAGRAAAIAREHGLVTGSGVPAVAHFSELPTSTPGWGSAIGVGAEGPEFVDLVAEGPHAIVGGTTGSGKSELLITWLVSMARIHSPAELTILLFDFKGGSSFGDVVRLPHCVGLLTDLDAAAAARAVASLAAELRYRERVLAAASARSIEDATDLPRLIVVVDEFAAMATDLPELHATFADLAARGRSLGVHLVLCTQRPSGVVRDAVLANASLRISLRVNNRADSIAVIGTDAAARAVPPGRAWLARAGESPTELQVAIATQHDIAAIAGPWSDSVAPRRPWLDPLPASLPHSGVPGDLGRIDNPDEQSQPPLRWRPADGNLLAIGGAASGRTSLLRAAAHGSSAVLIDADPEALWDAVLSPPSDLLLIDDLDLLVARMPVEYQQAVTEHLALLMRGSRTRVAVTAQRLTGAIQPLGALCGMRLLLRMPNRQEHVIAGGSAQTFDPDLPPGGGHYGDVRVQIALSDTAPEVARATSVPFAPRGLTLAVSPRAAALAARLAAAGHAVAHELSAEPGIVVTDLDGWHANWAAFTAAAKQCDVLFHECSPAEFRQLSRTRILPPLIVDPTTTAWLLRPDGVVERVRV